MAFIVLLILIRSKPVGKIEKEFNVLSDKEKLKAASKVEPSRWQAVLRAGNGGAHGVAPAEKLAGEYDGFLNPRY